MNVLIMAGGTGTRLWPASRKAKPKQLLKLFGDKTLLQNTYERVAGVTDPTHIYIGTTEAYAASVKKQLPHIPAQNFSIEPKLRDRGPAIGLAALIMEHSHPGSVFVTAWSDNHIAPQRNYISMLRKAKQYIKEHPDTTLQVGIPPTFPHTGMGYIHRGATERNRQGLALSTVKSFKEKPDEKTARKFLADGNYLWNSGIFIWNTTTLLSLYEQHLPSIYKLLMQIKPALGTRNQQRTINRIYPKMPAVDIESGLVEKLRSSVKVISADFEWADVGNWKIIKDIQSKHDENMSRGLHVDTGSKATMVYNYNPNQVVATAGLDNLIIIATPEAVLVANKDRAEEVKQLTRLLGKHPKLKKFL